MRGFRTLALLGGSSKSGALLTAGAGRSGTCCCEWARKDNEVSHK